jgi:hypothetical protein
LLDSNAVHTIQISDITKQNIQLLEKISNMEFTGNELITLPQYGQLKSMINKFGRCHIDLSKNLSITIGEQINVLKKEYTVDLDNLRKEKKRLVSEQNDSLQHLNKT